MDELTLVVIIIISLIPVSYVIMRLTGNNFSSLYDKFEKRSLVVKILITTVVSIVFAYAGLILIEYAIIQFVNFENYVFGSTTEISQNNPATMKTE